jgi:nitronate monooxygenase
LTREGETQGRALARRLAKGLSLPVIGAPMFIISQPKLVLAQCRAGIIGSFPALNARSSTMLDEWLGQIREELPQDDTLFALNLIVHRSNAHLDQDLEQCIRHKVPIVITSMGARPDVNAAVHAYGGIVLHDVITNTFARKAIEKGADGLIAVAAGAGGHAGRLSPFAFVEEIRAWFDGPLALSGAIASGRSILAAQVCGADFAYVGSAFIATQEANAPDEYKQAILDGGAEDIVYSNLFTGVHGNYLRSSILAAGLDPDRLPSSDASTVDFGSGGKSLKKAWRDIWGAGQGIGKIKSITGADELITRLAAEYKVARSAL